MDGLMFPKPTLEKKKPKGLARNTPLKAKKKYQYRPKSVAKTVSILQPDPTYCYLCGRRNGTGLNALEEHHIFEGNGRRPQSEKYGLKVYLCGVTCHREGPKSAHVSKETDDRLKRIAQTKFEEDHSREEFIAKFGKNNL